MYARQTRKPIPTKYITGWCRGSSSENLPLSAVFLAAQLHQPYIETECQLPAKCLYCLKGAHVP